MSQCMSRFGSVHVPSVKRIKAVGSAARGLVIHSSRVCRFFFFFRVPKHHQAHTREQTRLLLGACALMLGVNREINYIYILLYVGEILPPPTKVASSPQQQSTYGSYNQTYSHGGPPPSQCAPFPGASSCGLEPNTCPCLVW